MKGTSTSDASIGRTFIRNIDDREVTVHLSLLDLEISGDLDTEASEVAGRIGLVGELLADVTAAFETADAEYRNWRGRKAGAVLESDPKMAEWKVKADIDADAEFTTRKAELANYEGDLEFLRAYYDALKIKSQMVSARVSLVRGQLGSEGGLDSNRRGSAPSAPPRGPAPKVDPDDKAAANKKRARLAMGRKRLAAADDE